MDMDVSGRSQEKINLHTVRLFLKEHIEKETKTYFGYTNQKHINQVTENWFNDSLNYDGRWQILIDHGLSKSHQILDMAAGCGTFLLYGLNRGYNLWGVEPEKWKREYFNKKITASHYPSWFNSRIIAAYGEKLPFPDSMFDFITTYQTLEHVDDTHECLKEMLRVLKRNGILYIRAPDYNCFYEPHYRLPFFPQMNKKYAAKYLKIMKKPLLGLNTLNWITRSKVTKSLLEIDKNLISKDLSDYYYLNRNKKIKNILPNFMRFSWFISFLNQSYVIFLKILNFSKIGRQEKNIELWIVK